MKVALAAEGGYFAEKTLGIELHWGRGGGTRMSAEVPDAKADWPAKLQAAVEKGQVVVIDGAPAKPKSPRAPRRTRKSKPTTT